MEVHTQYTDNLRRFWIDDNLPKWDVLEGKLSFHSFRNCSISNEGQIIKREVTCSRKAIFLGNFLNIWGHCITDNLKRIWFLNTEEGRIYINRGYTLVCTLWKSDSFLPNFSKLLQYLNIDSSEIEIINDQQMFEELIVPDPSLTDDHHFYSEYKLTIDKIWNRIPMNSNLPQKVYFSRSKIKNYRDFGEYTIEAVFKKLGYEIIYPETLPLEQQFQILKSCKSFASTEGSVSHNVLFCRNGVECVIIRKSVTLNGYQFSANKIRDVSVVYIDSHLSLFRIFQDSFGPFFLYVNDNLVHFAKDRGVSIEKRFPRLCFLRYSFMTLFYAFRYRIMPRLISCDPKFYWHKLLEDFI